MKFTFLSVNMKTLYITNFYLSREFFYFVDLSLIMHIMWRTMALFLAKSAIRAILD